MSVRRIDPKASGVHFLLEQCGSGYLVTKGVAFGGYLGEDRHAFTELLEAVGFIRREMMDAEKAMPAPAATEIVAARDAGGQDG